ncbi:MAG: TolC family protein [Planctomycetota bacterium]
MADSTLSASVATAKRLHLAAPIALVGALLLAGCVSDRVGEWDALTAYQNALADRGPQPRADTEGQNLTQPLGLLRPTRSPDDVLPEIRIVTDPNTGQRAVPLAVEQAIARTLANSPEIKVVSFNPSIAKQEITKAAAEFDVTAFGSVNFEKEDNPPTSIFQPGQSDVRTFEYGVRQEGVTGSQWSLSYVLTRSWDDLVGRPLPTRYEPILGFQLRQPLLRDAWEDVTLAGVSIAKLNYRIALQGFREKVEDTTAQVVTAYWQLVGARREAEVYRELIQMTVETLEKMQGRSQIDATDIQIKQIAAFVKVRMAAFIRTQKAVFDAQDTLIRLMADTKLTMLDEFRVIPVSAASLEEPEFEISKILETAIRNNPTLQQARVAIEIADINVRVAENQNMPRLDLVGSARIQGLGRGRNAAQDLLETREFASYAVGVSLEYPLGNRQRQAELAKRRLEREQAVSTLQNLADQVAMLAREGIRRVEMNYSEAQLQGEAAEAARIHLQALEGSERIRDRLTPEFLLVKLQAQEMLVNTQRAEIGAIVDFNISLAQLARTLGTVLQLHQVSNLLPTLTTREGGSN